MLDAFRYLLCSKLCQHNRLVPRDSYITCNLTEQNEMVFILVDNYVNFSLDILWYLNTCSSLCNAKIWILPMLLLLLVLYFIMGWLVPFDSVIESRQCKYHFIDIPMLSCTREFSVVKIGWNLGRSSKTPFRPVHWQLFSTFCSVESFIVNSFHWICYPRIIDERLLALIINLHQSCAIMYPHNICSWGWLCMVLMQMIILLLIFKTIEARRLISLWL